MALKAPDSRASSSSTTPSSSRSGCPSSASRIRWTAGSSGLEGRYPAVRGLAFADPGTGWAVTGRGTSLDYGCHPPTPRCDDRGVLLRTTDGGTTWSEATPGR